MKRPGLLTWLAAGLTALPGAAQAHLVNSGLGPFYDGALHLLLSPGDLLGLLALALLAGLRGPTAARAAVIALPVAWLLGGLVGLSLPVILELAWLSTLSFMLMGVLVAFDARLPPVIIASLAGVYGVLHGLLNGSTLANMGAGVGSLLGIVLTALVLVLLASAAVVPLQAFWARITVRVAGSWVVAVGMLMLGWLAQSEA
ncbi:MAG: HupE/UreJ family protein [Candidatus Competibacteraceae bacterium]|jgi:hydrogenase/urease accessory protein HupE|nr:HupE/UreJ family protein [Candidatus Competibacteraceae bacterium]